MDYHKSLDELISLVQGSQNQANEAQQEGYWQPYEEFYSRPMQPPQIQLNSGSSMDNDQTIQLLTSLAHKVQNQNQRLENRAKELGELKNQMGEIVEFIGQIQAQSELSSSTSKPSQEEDEQLLLEEEEEDNATTSLEEVLPQPFKAPPPSNSGNVVPDSIFFDPVPPNIPILCRFMQSKEEEGEEGIFETFPKSQEKEVDRECLEFVKEGIGVDNKGHAFALKIPNLAECTIPRTFEVVFVLEFSSDHTGKPPPRILILFYTNILLMIQAPTLEFKPLPIHFNYHLPFKEKEGIVRLHDVKASASWEATHAINKERPRKHSITRCLCS